jgi:hypothetical protein
MKHKKIIAVAVGLTMAFAAGHLIAQPAVKPPAPPVDPEKEAFMSDFGAALRFGNQPKAIRMMDEAVGDPKFTDALIIKTWDMAYNLQNGKMDQKLDRRSEIQGTFLIKQQQKQIELLSEILVELRKNNGKTK